MFAKVVLIRTASPEWREALRSAGGCTACCQIEHIVGFGGGKADNGLGQVNSLSLSLLTGEVCLIAVG